jgi:dynein heavy chain
MGTDLKKQGFKILKASDDKISNTLEAGVKYGYWIMIEGVNEKLSPELEPILVPKIKTKGKNKTLKFGEKDLEYNNEFKFFMTTTIPNPH